MHNLRHVLAAVLFLCAGLVACGGGGGGGGSSTPPVSPTATASASPSAQPYTAAITGVSGISGSATAYASATVTVAAAVTSPTGVQLRRRQTATQTALVYFSITGSSATVTEFKATLTLSAPPSGSVSLSQWSESGNDWAGTNATVTVSGSNVSFDYVIPGGAATPVYFALYTGASLPTPSPSPSNSPSASPSASPTSSPASAANACMQTPNPSYEGGGVSDQTATFFSALENAKQACVSVYAPSGQVMSAMETALTNGANLSVIFPAEEYTSEESNASTLTSHGAHVIWLQDTYKPEYTIPATPSAEAIDQSYLPIHAKFALVDGVAYMDGHNWFESNPTDVILQDQNAADYTAMQTDLTVFPSAPPTVTGSNYVFTTDKGNSLNEEASVLTEAAPGAGYTVDFISESFTDYSAYGADAGNVYDALLAAAHAGATVNVIVEGSVSATSYEACDLSILAYNGANTYIQSAGGSEKILLVTNGSNAVTAAWFGSSNMTDYDYIDWGMTIPLSNTGVISALQTNYGNELNEASATPAPAASPTCNP